MNLEEMIKAAFAKVVEHPTDENLKEYENLLKIKKIEDAQSNGVGDKKDFEEKLTEKQKFVKDLREALSNGGTLGVPTEVSKEIDKLRYEHSDLRKLCTVHRCSGNYTILVEGTGVTVAYVSEGGAISDSGSNPGRAELSAYKLGALVKISNEFLNDSAADMADYIIGLIAKGFALKEDSEILLGTGSSNSHVTGIIPTVAGQTTPKTVVSATSGTATWAEVKATIQKLTSAYRKHATIIISQALLDQIGEFKDGGKYIFPQNEEITRILGRNVIVSADLDAAPTADADAPWMVVGDFSYYHIADRKDMAIRRLDERYADNDQTGFLAIQRIDGKVSVPDAFAVYYNKKTGA